MPLLGEQQIYAVVGGAADLCFSCNIWVFQISRFGVGTQHYFWVSVLYVMCSWFSVLGYRVLF